MKYFCILFLCLLSFELIANEGYVGIHGGNIQMKKHASVQMVKERVYITLYDNFYDVRCKFWFYNHGVTTTDTVGYPYLFDNQGYGIGGDKGLRFFKTKINGKTLSKDKISWHIAQNPPHNPVAGRNWYYWETTFPSYDTTIIENSYIGEYEIEPDNNDLTVDNMYYILGTGSSWYGAIIDGIIVVDKSNVSKYYDVMKLEREYQEKRKSLNYDENNNIYIFKLENYIPSKEETISFSKLPNDPRLQDCYYYYDYEDSKKNNAIREAFINNDMSWCKIEDYYYLKNLIFAKNGFVFKDSLLRRHFSSFPWYKPNPIITFDSLKNIDQRIILELNDILKKHPINFKQIPKYLDSILLAKKKEAETEIHPDIEFIKRINSIRKDVNMPLFPLPDSLDDTNLADSDSISYPHEISNSYCYLYLWIITLIEALLLVALFAYIKRLKRKIQGKE